MKRFLAFALSAFALYARAESLHLVAPAQGTTLRGGSFAELQWSASELPPHAEEWEAFLSINGGEYYAYRITPHLDLDLHRFTFIVPNVATHDARILIRVGDEVRESHFESSARFSITRDPRAELVLPRLFDRGRAESAREGDAAVIAWADGARDGSGVTQNCTPLSTSRSGFRARLKDASDVSALLLSAQSWAQREQQSSTVAARRTARDDDARAFDPRPASIDLLLVCGRLNI